jgi:hypothetical protein
VQKTLDVGHFIMIKWRRKPLILKAFLFSFKINGLRKIMGKTKPGFTGVCQGFFILQ